jgi:hypothetical protein
MTDIPWTDLERQLRSGEADAALRTLLATWKATPSPWLADLIDAVGALAARPPLAGRNVAERRVAWDKTAAKGDPADLPRLLDVLLPFGAATAVFLLGRLVDRGSDPRLAAPLVRWAAERPTGYQGQKSEAFWQGVARGLAESRDARALPVLQALYDRLEGQYGYAANAMLRTLLPPVIAALSALPEIDAPPEAVALRARLVPEPPAPSPELAALWQQVYADPASDAARHALATALSAAGDPRGEYVALQLLPKTGRADRQRIKELEAQHAEAWLGPLARVVKKSHRRFARGFLVGCRVTRHPDIAALDGVPELATVEDLELADYGTVWFFDHTPLPALRSLSGRCFSVFSSGRTLPVRKVGGVTDVPIHGATSVLAACTSLPALDELGLTAQFDGIDAWRAALSSPFAARLKRFATGRYEDDPGEWRRMVRDCLPRLERFALHLPVTRLTFEADRLEIEHCASAYFEGAALISGSDSDARSRDQLLAILSSGVIEPGDRVVVTLTRGRFEFSEAPVGPAWSAGISAALAGRCAGFEIVDVF